MQENTNKTPIYWHNQMNGDVVVVCHHIGATIVLVWHCLGIYQAEEHPQHVSSYTLTILLQPQIPIIPHFLPTFRKLLNIKW